MDKQDGHAVKVAVTIKYVVSYPTDQGFVEDGGYDEIHDELKALLPDRYAVAQKMVEYDIDTNGTMDFLDATEEEEVISIKTIK